MNPPGHGHLSVCPLQASGTEQGGTSGEPTDIRSPSDSPADRSCCGASLLWSQGTCSGPAAGIRAGEPRLGAVLPLMVSAGHTLPPPHTHTQRQVPQADPDMPLPFRAQMGTEAQSGGQTPRATISKPRDPRCPSEETSAPPHLPLPTGSTENK